MCVFRYSLSYIPCVRFVDFAPFIQIFCINNQKKWCSKPKCLVYVLYLPEKQSWGCWPCAWNRPCVFAVKVQLGWSVEEWGRSLTEVAKIGSFRESLALPAAQTFVYRWKRSKFSIYLSQLCFIDWLINFWWPLKFNQFIMIVDFVCNMCKYL